MGPSSETLHKTDLIGCGLLVRLFHELTFAITHTVRYTELAPIRFRNFWR